MIAVPGFHRRSSDHRRIVGRDPGDDDVDRDGLVIDRLDVGGQTERGERRLGVDRARPGRVGNGPERRALAHHIGEGLSLGEFDTGHRRRRDDASGSRHCVAAFE